MARNLLSVSLKYYKAAEIERIVNHNNRLSEIDYLLEKENILFDNVDVIYKHFDDDNINNKYLYNAGDYENQKDQINEYNLKNENNGDLLRFETLKLLNKKKQIQAKNKSYTKKSENEIVEMVISLSEEQAKSYLENGVDLTKGFDKFAMDLEEKYGFTPIGLSLHLDEGYISAYDDIENNIKKGDVKYNIHAHLVVLNFDFDKERSVLRNMKKQDMRDLQDLCQNSFQSVNLDFKRGVSKLETGKDHVEKQEFVINKLNDQIEKQKKVVKNLQNSATSGLKFMIDLNQKIKDLEKEIEKLEIKKSKFNTIIVESVEKIKNLNDDITKVNKIKKEHKEALIGLDKTSKAYSIVYKQVGEYMALEKEKRVELSQLKFDLDNVKIEKDSVIENIKNLKEDLSDKESLLKEKETIILEKTEEFNNLETKIVEKKELVVENYDEFDKYLTNEVNKNINPLIEKSMVGSGSIKNITKLKENILKMAKTFSESDVVISKYQNDRLELNNSKAIITNLKNKIKPLVEKNDNYQVQVDFFRDDNTKLNETIKGKDKIISDKNIAILEYEKTEKALKRFLIKHNISFDDFISFKQKHIGD